MAANRRPMMSFSDVLMIALIIASNSFTMTTQENTKEAMMYLSQFGYLNHNRSSGQLMTAEAFEKAVKEFQSFAGLNITGQLDEETRKVMELPRCGVKDKVGFGTDSRAKRYALQGSKWRKKDLTYKISKYPSNLARKAVDEEIKKAFNVWSSVTPLTFTQKYSGEVHIDVKFERGEHGDGDPFDGPGGTLAHAFFPIFGGDAHFDSSEKWTIDSYKGTNLFQVAAHEFGHSLGLSHSDMRNALMAPFYRGYESTFELHEDDVQAIQELYGRKKSSTPGKVPDGGRKTPPPTEDPNDFDDPELCNDATVDTIFNSQEGLTYAFKGDHYWRLTEDSIAPGYPRLIRDSWAGLPGNIDAAFTYPKNGKTYFFRGSQYWRYAGKQMDGNYPKRISEGFPGIPDDLDAAMVWRGNGKLYFFKGSKFWRFDTTSKPPVKSNYPKPISNWDGLPDHLDAAVCYTNGYTYFFKQGVYYRFNDRTFSVDQADPPFPRPAGYWWFGCRSETKAGITGETSDKNGSDEEVDGSDSGGLWNGGRRRRPVHRDDDVSDIILDGANPPERRIEHETVPRSHDFGSSGSGSTTVSWTVLAIVTSISLILRS